VSNLKRNGVLDSFRQLLQWFESVQTNSSAGLEIQKALPCSIELDFSLQTKSSEVMSDVHIAL